MEQGIFFEPGEGIAFSARGSSMRFKAVAATTGGAFSLMERKLPVSNRRPQPHTHAGPEGFYVLEGSIEFVVGGQSRVGGPGFWALVPSGVAHTFGNVGETPARLLIVHAPAADAYFAELQALWSGANPPTPEEERALMRRHGLEPVEQDSNANP
ncbi:MAG TPA: cupin domain-containing protein [Anaerolineales bacterium]|nr:cupin domain-containing protein [Anaerolineales bacterium]